jgi:regulation of enolase protein 1 (concanavalin A-like superfamily)
MEHDGLDTGTEISFVRNGRRSFEMLLLLMSCVVLGMRPASAADVVFRDDFNSAELQAGWTFVHEDASNHSLTARSGFFRINTQRGAFTDGSTVDNLLVRERSGDFILETRLEFDPETAQEFAGLLVYVDDTHAVALGLAYAQGQRGTFRGIVLLGVGGADSGSQRPATRYDATSSANPNVVFLRLLRSGSQFVAGYSADGVTYTDIGSITNELADPVMVGIGAANGDSTDCGAACDHSIAADFDYFQISTFGASTDGGPVGGITFDSLTVDGPAQVLSGATANLTATASFSDGSTLDVTDKAEWVVAPAGLGQIDAGVLTASTVTQTQQVTVVASYAHLFSSGGTTSRTGSTLVKITLPITTGGQPKACGVGILMPALMCWLSVVGRGRRLRRRA